MSYITFLFIFNGWQLVSDCDGCSHRRLCHTICSLLCFSLDKLLDRNNLAFPKDKLNSNWIYEGIVSSKMWTKNMKDFRPGSLLESRAKILQIFDSHFGINDDLINSIWIQLTFKNSLKWIGLLNDNWNFHLSFEKLSH